LRNSHFVRQSAHLEWRPAKVGKILINQLKEKQKKAVGKEGKRLTLNSCPAPSQSLVVKMGV